MQTDATLEFPVKPDPRSARVPPIAVHILERVAVSGSLHESARLVRDGIVRRVGERTERIVAEVDAGSVDVVLRARRGVLEVVAPAVLRHPGPFDERAHGGVAVVLTETFPTVLIRIETKQPARSSFVREPFVFIELDDVKGIDVRRVPIEEPTVRRRIVEERRVPRTWLHRVRFRERTRWLLVSRHRQPWKQA